MFNQNLSYGYAALMEVFRFLLLELGDCSSAPGCFFKTVSELCKLEKLRLEKGSVGVDFAKLSNAPKLKQVELIDFQVKSGFREGLKRVKNIQKLLLIPQYRVSKN